MIVVENKTFGKESGVLEMYERQIIENIHFKNVNFINLQIGYSKISHCTFENCTFTNFSSDTISDCDFVNCTLDGLMSGGNDCIASCKFYNLKMTPNQENANVFWLDRSTFINTDFSGQNTKFLTGCISCEDNKAPAVHIRRTRFVNSKIDFKTIEEIANNRNGILSYGEEAPGYTVALHSNDDDFTTPYMFIPTKNVKTEVAMNYIMAVLAHDVIFEWNDDDKLLKELGYYPCKIVSKLAEYHPIIYDYNGKEIDYNKIVPFNFDLKVEDKHLDTIWMTCDLSSAADQIDFSLYKKNEEDEK